MTDPFGAPTAPDVTQPAGGTAVLERPEVKPAEPGDHERFAHYVRKAKITESAVMGKPVIALCGKVWGPSRDPKNFPVCPACKEIYDGLMNPDNGQDEPA
ncbi:MAG: DUF3039 domain-containing protein [Promicromonosporaceae bacterium]|nr:DUF3039 domain-containing protein [Promicromonosporaceae bacterium]